MSSPASAQSVVWCCPTQSLDDPSVWAEAWASVSVQERAELEAMLARPHGRARQREALLARALCRRALSAACPAIAAVDWPLGHRASGAPCIDGVLPTGYETLTYSLSHTAGMVACGTCIGGRIGVDVEAVGRRVHAARLAARLFAKDELAYVMGQAQDRAQRQAFLVLWTLKEAYLKMCGLGLTQLTPEMAFDMSPDGSVRCLMDAAPGSALTAHSRLVADAHRLGIVVAAPGATALPMRLHYGWQRPRATEAITAEDAAYRPASVC